MQLFFILKVIPRFHKLVVTDDEMLAFFVDVLFSVVQRNIHFQCFTLDISNTEYCEEHS